MLFGTVQVGDAEELPVVPEIANCDASPRCRMAQLTAQGGDMMAVMKVSAVFNHVAVVWGMKLHPDCFFMLLCFSCACMDLLLLNKGNEPTPKASCTRARCGSSRTQAPQRAVNLARSHGDGHLTSEAELFRGFIVFKRYNAFG